MTELYLFPIKEAECLPDSFCRDCFPKRTERACRILRKEEKLRCLGAGALLHGLAGIPEEDLLVAEHGKPYAPTHSDFFSLSHSGKFSLLATDGEEIGADIEWMDPKRIRLAKEFFSGEESDWMEGNPFRRFYTVWTLKESVMKQTGLGFTLSPRSFSVLPLIRGESVSIGQAKLYAATTESEDHMIAVCSSHPIDRLSPQIVTAEQILSLHK